MKQTLLLLSSAAALGLSCACVTSQAQAQTPTEAVSKVRATGAITADFNSGSKTIKITSGGTLQYDAGASLAGDLAELRGDLGLGSLATQNAVTLAQIAQGGATSGQMLSWNGTAWAPADGSSGTYSEDVEILLAAEDMAEFRDLLDVEPGVNVQAYDSDLASIAALTTTSYGRALLALADAAALRTAGGLVIGTNVQAYDADLATFAGITPSSAMQTFLGSSSTTNMRASMGVTIGTHVQGYDADLTTWAGITPGTGVDTWLATPSSSNFAAAITGETGTGAVVLNTDPTFTGKVTINKAGQSEAGGIETIDDPANGTVRALRVLGPDNSTRIYFGKSGQTVYALNFEYVTQLESVPGFELRSGFYLGGVTNTYITRADGGTAIGASHPDGGGLRVFQENAWDTTTAADLALQVLKVGGTTIFGTTTSLTNFEGLNLAWDGTRFVIKPVAGADGGTVRAARYYLTGTVWIGSGSGSPESVEAAGVGSIYTDTATGSVYRKTSGSGNTGWVTP